MDPKSNNEGWMHCSWRLNLQVKQAASSGNGLRPWWQVHSSNLNFFFCLDLELLFYMLALWSNTSNVHAITCTHTHKQSAHSVMALALDGKFELKSSHVGSRISLLEIHALSAPAVTHIGSSLSQNSTLKSYTYIWRAPHICRWCGLKRRHVMPTIGVLPTEYVLEAFCF